MSICHAKRVGILACLLILTAACGPTERPVLDGTWRVTSYLKADNQVRYQTDGYMMFGESHWLHLMFFNRDERPQDFSEAHHGTYEITGPDTLSMDIDMELHMDPRSEYQDTPVWYGPAANLEGAHYRIEGNEAIIDLPSTAQLVLQRLE